MLCFALPICHMLTTDVMLEIPSMAVVLGGDVSAARHRREVYISVGRLPSPSSAGIGGLDETTHRVFLGVVPFIVRIDFRENGPSLLRKEIWISSAWYSDVFCIGMYAYCTRTIFTEDLPSSFRANAEYAETL